MLYRAWQRYDVRLKFIYFNSHVSIPSKPSVVTPDYVHATTTSGQNVPDDHQDVARRRKTAAARQ